MAKREKIFGSLGERRYEQMRSACGSLLMFHFYLEAQVFDHSPDLRGWGAWCRQVAVHKDGVGRIEGEWLKASEVVFPPARDADFGARVKKAEETKHF